MANGIPACFRIVFNCPFIFGRMRVAVFALGQEADFSGEVIDWLQRFVAALVSDHRTHAVAVFTNVPEWQKNNISEVPVYHKPPAAFFWGRWQQLRQWRTQLAAFNADKVFYFGLPSAMNLEQPSVLYLTPDDFKAGRLRRKRATLLRQQALWVPTKAAVQQLSLPTGPNLPPVVAAYGAPPPSSLVEVDTQLVKDRFTEGAEYFLFHGPLQATADILCLLKAFSRFKHRQKSGWKLLLLSDGSPVPGPLQQLLATYKFRGDVVALGGPTEKEVVQSFYAAAHCFVQPSFPGGTGTPLLAALAWGLPVVATTQCREWAGNAGIYFENGNEAELAAQLMTIYKDEALHARLAKAARAEAGSFSWQPLLDSLLHLRL